MKKFKISCVMIDKRKWAGKRLLLNQIKFWGWRFLDDEIVTHIKVEEVKE